MKLYRYVIGGLLVMFIAIGVWYVFSNMNEQRSMEGGTLIWRMEDVTSHCLC